METDVRYLITLAAGLLAAAAIFAFDLKRKRIRSVLVFPGFAAGIAGALILGKAGFLLFHTHYFTLYGAGCLFRASPDEFSFVCACGGFVLGLWLVCRAAKVPGRKAMNCFAVSGCVLAAFAKFAEVFAGDLALVELYTFGMEELTAESPLAFFPLAIRDDWGQVMLSASTAEALWTLLCVPAACLIRKKGGSAFAFCAFTLCACHFFIDTVKIVSIVFYYVHVEQALCALVMLALLARQARTCGGRAAAVLIPAVLCIAVNGLTQYLLDKPSTFAWMMSEEAFGWLNDHLAPFCYTVMLCTALGLLALGHFQYRKKTDREME